MTVAKKFPLDFGKVTAAPGLAVLVDDGTTGGYALVSEILALAVDNDAPGTAVVGIASSAVNGAGHLILTFTDQSTHDAGLVVGPAGRDGTNGINAGYSPNTYTASGPIAVTDTLSVINSAAQCDMTLGSGTVNGQEHEIKRFGAGPVTVTLTLDGAAGAVVTANSPTIREAIRFVWDAPLATHLAM